MIDFVLTSSPFDPDKFRLIVCGDFNGLNQRYNDLSHATLLRPIVHKPTRGSNVLDQIFVNFPILSQPKILPPLGKSDHSVIFWCDRPHRCSSVRKVVTRKFSASRRSRFAELLIRTDWLTLVKTAKDLDSCASFFMAALFHLYNLCFPERTIRFRSIDPPWMKPSLKILVDDRDRAFTCGQTHKYLRLRKEVVKHTRQLKERYLKSALASHDSGRSWNSLRLIGRFSKASSPKLPVESLNHEFVSNFHEDAVELPIPLSTLPSSPITVSCDEVLILLRKLKNKSSGPDGVPAWLFREFASVLSPAVTFIFNWSLRDCQVPFCFKVANITPVPKCSPAVRPPDFRPISLLPVLSKVLEKVVKQKWMLPHMSCKMSSSQFAYLPGAGKGTVSALTLLYHDIVKFLDSSGGVRILSIDFAKAFDKILHTKIIEAMNQFAFPKEAVLWTSSFLTHRLQRVKVKNEVSNWQPVLSGVPQGSVIGPLLFCLFIDGLQSLCTNSLTYKYADDINIVHFFRKTEEDNLQQEYDNVLEWSNRNRLPLNKAKCCVLDVITKRSITTSPITSHKGFLPQVSSLRVLGVTISSDLKWNMHVENALKKANRRLYLLRNLKRASCPMTFLTLAYNSIIRSTLLYAYPCFCNLPGHLKEKLLRFERRVFRIIGCERSLSVIEAGERSCQRLFDKVVHSSSHPLRRCFTQQATKTRQSLQLRPVRAKTVRLSNSFVRFGR
jgi:hypothetical protein